MNTEEKKEISEIDEIDHVRSQLQSIIGDTSGVLFNSPDLSAENTPAQPLSDCMLPDAAPEDMSVDELTRAIGALRAARDRSDMAPKNVPDRPRLTAPELKTHETTSRYQAWCKVREDGFTPTKQPSMRISTTYDSDIAVPTRRTWTFLDQFKKEDDVIETWTINYPCRDLSKVARDITYAWQVYSAPDLKVLDAELLANTPVSVQIAGISGHRYLDVWSALQRKYNAKLPSNAKWTVANGEIVYNC